MTTRSELIESIHSALHSYTGVHEQVTALDTEVDSSETTLHCTRADGAKRGIAEIGDELIYVDGVEGNALNLPSFGRGYRGSTATVHPVGSMVTFDPTFPRHEIGKTVDQVVAALFPALFQVKESVLTSQAVDVSYALPPDVEHVLRVEAKLNADPADYWAPIVNWELEKTTTVPVLNLYEGGVPGWSVKVAYAAKFGALTADFATAGIPESYVDLITYGVTQRLIRFLEPARLQLASVENTSRAQYIQSGDAGRTATQLYALYQQRVAEERRRLLEQYPARPNFLSR